MPFDRTCAAFTIHGSEFAKVPLPSGPVPRCGRFSKVLRLRKVTPFPFGLPAPGKLAHAAHAANLSARLFTGTPAVAGTLRTLRFGAREK
jgi:hypothetical protein